MATSTSTGSKSLLFTPFKLAGVELPNRICVSPMCQYSCEDGFASDWHLVHLGSRATGGAGLIFVEATAVEPKGRISPQDLGLWKDEHIEPLARIVQFVHNHSASKIGIQIAHAGRKASTRPPWLGRGNAYAEEGGWEPIGPSALKYDPNSLMPHELTVPEIQQLIQCFQDTAARALRAGFDVIEIHAAHGYLIHSFLSPISNQRTDQYGGSFENRIRFMMEVTQAVKRVVPADYPIVVRLSAQDWVEEKPSWTLDQTVELCKHLKQAGVCAIDCSSGGLAPEQKIITGPNYQVPFAERVRREAEIPSFAVGEITEAEQAEQILQKEQADLINIGRALLLYPYWSIKAAAELGEPVKSMLPNQYLRGLETVLKRGEK